MNGIEVRSNWTGFGWRIWKSRMRRIAMIIREGAVRSKAPTNMSAISNLRLAKRGEADSSERVERRRFGPVEEREEVEEDMFGEYVGESGSLPLDEPGVLLW